MVSLSLIRLRFLLFGNWCKIVVLLVKEGVSDLPLINSYFTDYLDAGPVNGCFPVIDIMLIVKKLCLGAILARGAKEQGVAYKTFNDILLNGLFMFFEKSQDLELFHHEEDPT